MVSYVLSRVKTPRFLVVVVVDVVDEFSYFLEHEFAYKVCFVMARLISRVWISQCSYS